MRETITLVSECREWLEVRSLASARAGEFASLLAEAFVEDPGWRDVGPNHARQRWLALWCYYRAVWLKALRWGRPGYMAFADGRLAGVAVTFDWRAWPPPEPAQTLLDVPAFALAGPLAARRAGRAAGIIGRAHFREPHLFLWQLAVHPNLQRRGVGQALLARVAADADAAALPVFLETANPDNLPYYHAHGFLQVGAETLPRGAPLWLMLRPAPDARLPLNDRVDETPTSRMRRG